MFCPPLEGQVPILPGLMQGPIPAGLALVIEIVLDSPTTWAPKPGERSLDPAEHALTSPVPLHALSSLPDAETTQTAAYGASNHVEWPTSAPEVRTRW
jgi:hypothetical protein